MFFLKFSSRVREKPLDAERKRKTFGYLGLKYHFQANERVRI